MARFQATISFNLHSSDAIGARSQAETIIDAGVRHGYVADGTVVSVEPVAEPIYTQAQMDKAVADAVAETAATWATRVNSNV